MKKKIIVLVTVSLVLSLSVMAGCTKKPAEDSSSTPPVSSEAPKKAESGQLDAVYNRVMTDIFGSEAPRNIVVDEAVQIEEQFGLTADMMKDHLIVMPLVNIQVDTFIGIEAAEGKAQEVAEKLSAYKDKIIADREAFPYLTDHLPKAKGAQVITIDDYVFYLSLGNAELTGEEGEDVQKLVDAEIQKAVKSVESILKK